MSHRTERVPARIAAADQVRVWLIDKDAPEKNPNLEFVFTQAADAVAELRAQGKTVLLHCMQAQSWTASVAAQYSVRHGGVESMDVALVEVCGALPSANPNRAFRQALAGRSELVPPLLS